MADTDNLSHAYIVSSVSESFREAKALELAAAIICESAELSSRPCRACRHCRKAFAGIHPDIISVVRLTNDKGKQRAEILVDQIRGLAKDSAVLPNEAEKKVYIVHDADTMNSTAQNAFLKLLEEPPAYVAFILCAENPRLLLDTVRSRCRQISINAEDSPPDEASLMSARRYFSAFTKNGRAERLRVCAGLEGMDKEQARGFVHAACFLLNDTLCARPGSPEIDMSDAMELAALLDKADAYLNANVGVKHVLGLLAVFVPGDASENMKL